MAPTLARPPFHRDGWVYEEKVDGWRMLAYKDGRPVRLISRNAVDHTARFRELTAAVVKLKPGVRRPRDRCGTLMTETPSGPKCPTCSNEPKTAA
jgi:hypothetical protein